MAKTILVIEDNRINMELFRECLREANYDIVESSDGSDVHDLIALSRPDLIVMDIQLPHRSGLDIIVELKSKPVTASIPIFAVSAFGARGDEERIRDAGCSEFMAKPISVPKFVETVSAMLES